MSEFKEEWLESVKKHRFERSRHLIDFHVAGFAYYDGLEVIDELTLGKPVQLIAEVDNPHDPDAVVIYYQDYKLGYVPSSKNIFLHQLLYFGHATILEARIQYVNKESHPERQFRVVVKLKDQRTN